MVAAGRSFTVTVTRKETVAARLPKQDHWLPFSNLDLLLPPLDFGVFFCYRKPDGAIASDFPAIADRLKASLEEVLVHYYALAGEVVENSQGEPELLCNNRGVDFDEAAADARLWEIEFYDPDVAVEGKLVPRKKAGVLCVQVTELRCGGVVIGCSFDHRVADAYSANMFIVSWAEAAVGKPISVIPSFRRSLLIPRRPPVRCRATSDSIGRLYGPLSSLSPPEHDDDEAAVNRIYYVAAKDIARMQEAASGAGGHTSKLEAFSAYLWRIVGKTSKLASRDCAMGIVVDGRARLGIGSNGTPSMENYFGNMLSILFGSIGVEDMETMELGEVAEAVRRFLKEGVTEEHFRGLIDWVEDRRPEPAQTRIYSSGSGGGSSTAFVVSSGQRFPVSSADFGWGTPALGSYHFPWGGSAGYVMPMPSAVVLDGDVGGDWVVYVHLARRLVAALEAVDGGGVFQPLTPRHMGLTSDVGDVVDGDASLAGAGEKVLGG